MTKTEAAAIYRKAADIIEARGWTQGVFFDERGGCCATGALMVAGGYDPGCGNHWTAPEIQEQLVPYYEAREFGRVWLFEDAAIHAFRGRSSWEGLVAFNDSLGTTKDMVVTVLRGIATGIEQAA